MKRIPIAEPDLSGNEVAYVTDAIAVEGRVSSSGKYLDRFEAECQKAFKRAHALSCSNGTTALHLALLGLGIGPGDEVIVPAFTFAATASAVIHAGATPIFADVREDTWNLDERKLDALLSPRTKAVIAVDIYGVPCEYDVLAPWCKEHGLFLVEDAAEAHGARYAGAPAGSFGDVSVFSFYGNKILTMGEGGVVVTDDADLHERMRVLKNHGMAKPGLYDNEVVGYNYRLTNVQAAIGCAQFERFGDFLAKRQRHAARYRELLEGLPLRFQRYDADKIHAAPWLFSLTIEGSITTEQLMAGLAEAGIDTRAVFKPLHLHAAFKAYAPAGAFPVSEGLGRTGISIPSSSLLTDEDQVQVADAIRRILKP